jgi:hypothetical protein
VNSITIDQNLDMMDQLTEKTTFKLDINGAAIYHENVSDLGGGTLSPKTPLVGDYPNRDIIILQDA